MEREPILPKEQSTRILKVGHTKLSGIGQNKSMQKRDLTKCNIERKSTHGI